MRLGRWRINVVSAVETTNAMLEKMKVEELRLQYADMRVRVRVNK